MRLSHVGIIVKDIEEGIKHHEKLFGMKQIGPIVEDLNQKVKVVLVAQSDDDPVKIELIQPMTPDSPVSQLLKKRQSLYHLCFEVDDIAGMMGQLKEKGVRLINEEPVVMEGRKMAFVHPKSASGVLVELYEVI